MTRDPRKRLIADDDSLADRSYIAGSNARLAALLPQLEAADALFDVVNSWLSIDTLMARHGNDGSISDRLTAYLAACDAHLTEGTPE